MLHVGQSGCGNDWQVCCGQVFPNQIGPLEGVRLGLAGTQLCQDPVEPVCFDLQQAYSNSRHCLCLIYLSTDGVLCCSCAGAGTVDVMSGTQRDENNLFMARMDAPSPEQLQQRLVGMLSADGAVDDPYAQQHKTPPLPPAPTARDSF